MWFLVRSCVMGRGAASFSISIAIALASKVPTQIGMTVSDATSFRTTIGMFVAGSIMSPRIRTSTSMDSPPAVLLDGYANQAVGKCAGNFHLEVASRSRSNLLRTDEIHWLVLTAASRYLSSGRVLIFNHYFQNMPYLFGIVDSLDLPLSIQEHLEPACFFRFWN